jgi:hypothetical protein
VGHADVLTCAASERRRRSDGTVPALVAIEVEATRQGVVGG